MNARIRFLTFHFGGSAHGQNLKRGDDEFRIFQFLLEQDEHQTYWPASGIVEPATDVALRRGHHQLRRQRVTTGELVFHNQAAGRQQYFTRAVRNKVVKIVDGVAVDDPSNGARVAWRCWQQAAHEDGAGAQRLGHVVHQIVKKCAAGAGRHPRRDLQNGALHALLSVLGADADNAECQIVGQFAQQLRLLCGQEQNIMRSQYQHAKSHFLVA